MPPKKLGLEDGARVQLIVDRGEDFYRSRGYSSHHPREEYTPLPGTPGDLLEKIGKELDESKVESALDPNKEYLPRHKLTKIITPERVRTILNQTCFKDCADKDKLTSDICFGRTPRLKLLAALIGTGRSQDILEYIKDGMHDKCLPMKLDISAQRTIYCPHHEEHHSTINSYERPNARKELSRWFYSLSAPYIRCSRDKHSHYVLQHGDVFPMETGWKMQTEDKPGTHLGGAASTMPNYGGYSEVYKVRIDESHYKFPDVGMHHPDKFFALKRLTSHDRENFNLELSSLLFSMDNASGKKAHSHLIQLLATFEVSDPSAHGPTYYLLFDWAEGNLKDFWKANTHLVGNRSHSLWMAQQFHHICSAVQCVHNERERTLKTTDTSKLAKGPSGRVFDIKDLYGRHGDIKPDNFLWFHPKGNPSGLLALSDFGLGRLHTQVSRSNQDPRKLAYTATYIAPEFDLPDGMISRTSDIFSLGCVFLEYATWFLKGIDSVENDFPGQRNDKDVYGFDADKFFIIRHDESSATLKPFLKPQVKAWIEELQADENCSWYLYQLLELIRDKMLEPDREKRIHIVPLIKEMEMLRLSCERNESFYLKSTKES